MAWEGIVETMSVAISYRAAAAAPALRAGRAARESMVKQRTAKDGAEMADSRVRYCCCRLAVAEYGKLRQWKTGDGH